MMSKKQRTKEEEKEEFDKLFSLLSSLAERGKTEEVHVSVSTLQGPPPPQPPPQNKMARFMEHLSPGDQGMEFQCDNEIIVITPFQEKTQKKLVKPQVPSAKPQVPSAKPQEPFVKPQVPSAKPHEPLVKPQEPSAKLQEHSADSKQEVPVPQQSFQFQLATDQIQCFACLRVYSTSAAYRQHLETSGPCIEALSNEEKKTIPYLQQPLHLLLDHWLSLSTTQPDSPLTCRHCKTTFSTRSNLNKHYSHAITCNRLAYHEFKKIIQSM